MKPDLQCLSFDRADNSHLLAGFGRFSCVQRLHLLYKPVAEPVLLDFEVITDLEIEPESLGGPKVPSQSQAGICGDAAGAADDFVDPARRDTGVLGQAILANV